MITTLEMFAMQTRLYNNVLNQINEENAQLKSGTSSNHFAWLAGHIMSSRHSLCNLLGGKNEEPFPVLFEKGQGIQDVKYPSLQELTAGWDELSSLLIELLSSISNDRLSSEAPYKVPMGDGSIRSVIEIGRAHV